MDVPPKVKFFLWKLVCGILPTSINLVYRFVDVGPLCHRCGRDTEMEDNLFRTCAWVATFWESNPAAFMQFIVVDGEKPFSDWVMDSLTAIPDSEQRALFAVQLWIIWFSRNQLLFKQTHFTHSQIQESSARLLSEFLGAKLAAGTEGIEDMVAACTGAHKIEYECFYSLW
ncbi:hypothetical protein ACS0TY_013200 [Phlomoides rotata]